MRKPMKDALMRTLNAHHAQATFMEIHENFGMDRLFNTTNRLKSQLYVAIWVGICND